MHSVRIPRDRERSVHAEHLTEASSFRSREALSSSRSVPSVPRTLRHRSLACAARRAVRPRPRAPGRTMSAGVGPGSLDVTMSLDATSGRDPSIEAASLGPRERNPSSDMPEASSTLPSYIPPQASCFGRPVTSSRRLPVRRRASAVSTIPGSTTLRASNLVGLDVTHRGATRLASSSWAAGAALLRAQRSARRSVPAHWWDRSREVPRAEAPSPSAPTPTPSSSPSDLSRNGCSSPSARRPGPPSTPRGARYGPAPFTASRGGLAPPSRPPLANQDRATPLRPHPEGDS